MVVLAVAYCRLPASLREAWLLLRKTFIVLVCLLLYILLKVITLCIRIYTGKKDLYQHFYIWVLYAIAHPISLLVFPIGFLLCFYSIKAFGWKCCSFCCHLRTCALCFVSCNTELQTSQHVQQQPAAAQLTQGTSVPESTRVSPLSSTFFHVPYTNSFTHITTENEPLIGPWTVYRHRIW